jgi:hypothetical protein
MQLDEEWIKKGRKLDVHEPFYDCYRAGVINPSNE